MKILYLLTCAPFWKSGCWLYRCKIPQVEMKKRGHDIRFVPPFEEMTEEWLDWPDVVVYGVYGGMYRMDPIPTIKEYQKRGKKVVYDLDDDIFTVNPDNPSSYQVKKNEGQVKKLLKIADIVTTTTPILRKKFLKYNKNVVVCPNSLDPEKFTKRKGGNQQLRIGFTGAASHWADLDMVMDVLFELQKKYDFLFILEGMCGTELINEVYNCEMVLKLGLEPEKRRFYESTLKAYSKIKRLKYIHKPFYSPVLYPAVLGQCNLDIGICPLKDNVFNRSKSCIKFYEYAMTGTVTLASNVLPYKKEVGYCAKNTYKDWYNKLEKLIVDEKFRQKLLEKQQKFVYKHRDIKDIVKLWEKAFKKH